MNELPTSSTDLFMGESTLYDIRNNFMFNIGAFTQDGENHID